MGNEDVPMKMTSYIGMQHSFVMDTGMYHIVLEINLTYSYVEYH